MQASSNCKVHTYAHCRIVALDKQQATGSFPTSFTIIFLKFLSCFVQLLLLVGDFELERHSMQWVSSLRLRGGWRQVLLN
jgi:hypothetical protein